MSIINIRSASTIAAPATAPTPAPEQTPTPAPEQTAAPAPEQTAAPAPEEEAKKKEPVRGIGTVPAANIIAGLPASLTFRMYSLPTEYTPEVNPNHAFPDWVLRYVAPWLSIMPSTPLFITGPTGCGKTSSVKQMLARLNWNVFECTGHSRLEFSDLVGHLTVRDGNMEFEYGPLARAMKFGGAFILNEMDLLDPSTSAGLNSILDGSPLIIPENGGEIIIPDYSPKSKRPFAFIATANSNGTGDATGMYTGVLMQNGALMDRFTVVEADYLPAETEKQVILKSVPAIGEDTADLMVKLAGDIRTACSSVGTQSGMSKTMSTRTLVRWAQWAAYFTSANIVTDKTPLFEAYKIAFLGACDSTDKVTAQELYQRTLGA